MANDFASALESAQKTGTPVAEFTGDVRAMGATFLEELETFRIPNDFKVFKNPELSARAGKDVCFTVVEILDDNGNVVSGKQVYPGMFNRTVYHYHKDDKGEIKNMHETFTPKGAPIDDYNSEKTTQLAMKKIAGKKIKVKKIDYIETRNFERTDTTTQSVYTLEYAQ